MSTDWPTLEWIEREYTEARLRHFGGNKTLAAKSLGINLKTLYNRLSRYKRMGAPVRVAKTVKPRVVTEGRRKRLATEARVTAQVIEMVRTLVDAPLRGVPMTAKEVRARIGKGNCHHGGNRRRSRNSWRSGEEEVYESSRTHS